MRILSVAVFLLLAGCSSQAPPDPEGLEPSLELTPTTLSNGLSAPVLHTVWGNGTVPVQDTCLTGACINDEERAFHRLNLDSHVPIGVPVHVVLDVTYQPHQLFADSNEAWFAVDDGTFYAYQATFDPGHLQVDAVVLARSGLRAVFGARVPGGGATETPFTMGVLIQAHPQDVPPGVPVLVSGQRGDDLRVGTPFLLFGPDDQPLGRFDVNASLPSAGEFLVLLPPDGPAANVTTTGTAKTWRASDLTRVAADPIHLPFTGEVDAPWQVTGVPLGLGLLVRPVAGPSGPMLASVGFQVQVQDAQGRLLDSGPQCGGCLTLGDFGFVLATPLGDPRVTAGEYTIHGESTFTADIEFVPFSIHASR